jgi:hypothetical protein
MDGGSTLLRFKRFGPILVRGHHDPTAMRPSAPRYSVFLRRRLR